MDHQANSDQKNRGEGSNRLSPSADVSGASDEERKKIDEQSRPSAILIHETIRAEGESELQRSGSALLLSGLAAGLSMGFSLVAQGILQAHLPELPGRELIAKAGYTVGFLIVVLGRQQLFTENTLTPILPLLHDKSARTLVGVLRLWALVLVSNLVGAALFAAVIARTAVFDPDVKAAFMSISGHIMDAPFYTTLVRGIFAGWLIALMVWMLPAAQASRPVIIIIITYVVAIGDLAHVIAGSIDGFYLIWSNAATFGDYVGQFLCPALIGNIIGGVMLVAALNFGQVASEVKE